MKIKLLVTGFQLADVPVPGTRAVPTPNTDHNINTTFYNVNCRVFNENNTTTDIAFPVSDVKELTIGKTYELEFKETKE